MDNIAFRDLMIDSEAYDEDDSGSMSTYKSLVSSITFDPSDLISCDESKIQYAKDAISSWEDGLSHNISVVRDAQVLSLSEEFVSTESSAVRDYSFSLFAECFPMITTV
jgi:hypothetical protein